MPALRAMAGSAVRFVVLGAAHAMAGLLALLLLISLLYASGPLYRFPDAASFRGARWYNPYDALPADGWWRKANFHAHSEAWGGVTNGNQSPTHVAAAYRDLRYDIVGVSNYHTMSAASRTGTFPVYEQGWNVQKSHRLAIGGDAVVWRDYPLGQTVHQKQDILDRLRETGAVVVIAHPAIRNGHSTSDLQQLTGYEALEVLNHFVPPATSHWDAALSAGRAVWAIGSDDSHDIHGTGETGVHWTLVHAPSNDVKAVQAAVRAGRTIGVRGVAATSSLEFVGQRVLGDTLEVRVRGPVGRIVFTGQEGAERPAQISEQDGITIARAVARAQDGYLRASVEGRAPRQHDLLLLNPMVRWDGRALGAGVATIDAASTAALRWVALCAYAVALAPLRRRRRKRPSSVRPLPA